MSGRWTVVCQGNLSTYVHMQTHTHTHTHTHTRLSKDVSYPLCLLESFECVALCLPNSFISTFIIKKKRFCFCIFCFLMPQCLLWETLILAWLHKSLDKCLILQITDYGLPTFIAGQNNCTLSENNIYISK